MEYVDVRILRKKKHDLNDLFNQAVKLFNATSPKKKSTSSSSSSKTISNESASNEEDMLDLHMVDIAPKPTSNNNAKKVDADRFFTGSGSSSATNRLIKDLTAIHNSHPEKFGYSAEPLNDNLYHWEVKLFGFEEGGLKTDLGKLHSMKGSDHVVMDMKFPSDYPFSPPFIRVVKPRFQFHTGHVTIGGSICMELLTRSGWSPGNDIESILVQIRTEMISGGARVDFQNTREYSEEEARQAFERVAKQHGWN